MGNSARGKAIVKDCYNQRLKVYILIPLIHDSKVATKSNIIYSNVIFWWVIFNVENSAEILIDMK